MRGVDIPVAAEGVLADFAAGLQRCVAVAHELIARHAQRFFSRQRQGVAPALRPQPVARLPHGLDRLGQVVGFLGQTDDFAHAGEVPDLDTHDAQPCSNDENGR